jgi:ZIP family zinc transporter
MNNYLFAFLLTLFAGLATGLGSAIAFFAKKTNPKFLSASLGFSAGVMIYVSFVEILSKSQDALSISMNEKTAYIISTLSFFGGIGLIALIDNFVPSYENPHELKNIEELNDVSVLNEALDRMEEKEKSVDGTEFVEKHKLYRMGILSALAIGIHNFPEGLATFVSALQNPQLGISIAVAIAIHNIPEGIAVSVPVYYATGDKKKAFLLSFLSGLSEPIGALIGFLILKPFLNDTLMGIIFGAVAGIMVFISLDELLPAAEKYGEHHVAAYSLIVGMAVMALSLVLFM